MFLVEVTCQNPNCAPGGLRTKWSAALEKHRMEAECPVCRQVAYVTLTHLPPDLTGRCDRCNKPIDDHTKERCP